MNSIKSNLSLFLFIINNVIKIFNRLTIWFMELYVNKVENKITDLLKGQDRCI